MPTVKQDSLGPFGCQSSQLAKQAEPLGVFAEAILICILTISDFLSKQRGKKGKFKQNL